MIQAIRQKVQVKADGRIEIVAPELQIGMEVEVTVMLQASDPSNVSQQQLPRRTMAEQLRDSAKKYANPIGRSIYPEIVVRDDTDDNLEKYFTHVDAIAQAHKEALDQAHEEAIDQAQKLLRRFIPEGVSLVDELIRERREASELE